MNLQQVSTAQQIDVATRWEKNRFPPAGTRTPSDTLQQHFEDIFQNKMIYKIFVHRKNRLQKNLSFSPEISIKYHFDDMKSILDKAPYVPLRFELRSSGIEHFGSRICDKYRLNYFSFCTTYIISKPSDIRDIFNDLEQLVPLLNNSKHCCDMACVKQAIEDGYYSLVSLAPCVSASASGPV